MKEIAIIIILSLFASQVYSQSSSDNCPQPIVENYSKVLNVSFASEYKDCPVTIEADFWEAGPWKGAYKYPKKTKSYVMFQCVERGGQGTKAQFSNDLNGQIVLIDKSISDVIFTFKRGDKIELTGTTWTYSFFGVKSVFFIATKVEKG
ncbi:MAG: hypothetical protein M9887_02030 [Chitinophagales bacterium]|nr:hypothetical protein [Chitinophagales bacterium]